MQRLLNNQSQSPIINAHVIFFFMAFILIKSQLYADSNSPLSHLEKTQWQVIKNACGADPISADIAQHMLETAPQELKDIVTIIKKAQICNSRNPLRKILPPRILFVGAPGVGKSTLARLMAQLLNRELIFVRAPMLGTEYQNSEIVNLTQIFEAAFTATNNVILVLDEINVLTEPRKNNPQGELSIAATLWLLLDKCAEYPHILVIGTCNDATKLPDQLKDRFIGNIIEIARSGEHERFRLLKFYRDQYQIPCMDDVLFYFAKKTDGFSARQLEALIIKAYQISVLEKVVNPLVLKRHLDKAYHRLMMDTKLVENKKVKWLDLMEKYSYVLPYISFGGQATALVGTAIYYLFLHDTNFSKKN